jgi:predicted transcriptional regulator
MTAEQLLTSDLPILRPIDTVKCALDMMDECKVSHLPLVVEDQYKGLVSERNLLECDESAVLAEVECLPFSVDPNLHVYEVVSLMSRSDLDVLPVVHRGIYRGSIDRGSILNFFTQVAGWGAEGSTIVLELPTPKFSLHEIARHVEENGASISSFNTCYEDSGEMIVTIKLNTVDIGPILETFKRFDYKVTTFFDAPEVEDEIRSKFDQFMRYLEQ